MLHVIDRNKSRLLECKFDIHSRSIIIMLTTSIRILYTKIFIPRDMPTVDRRHTRTLKNQSIDFKLNGTSLFVCYLNVGTYCN